MSCFYVDDVFAGAVNDVQTFPLTIANTDNSQYKSKPAIDIDEANYADIRNNNEAVNSEVDTSKVDTSEAENYPVHRVPTQELLNKEEKTLALEDFKQFLQRHYLALKSVLTPAKEATFEPLVSLSRDKLLQDLDYLEKRLEDQSSYLLLGKFDYKKEIFQLKNTLESETSGIAFARKIKKYIAKIGDAHARVRVDLNYTEDRFLPFAVADSSIGIIALTSDQNEFVDAEFPILTSIDGQPLSVWLQSAGEYVPQASAQLIRYQTLRELRAIDLMRDELGLKHSRRLKITLTSIDGKKHKKLTLKTRRNKLPSGKVKLDYSKILPGNIGYLRIPTMYATAGGVIEAMAIFRDTDGLIIDVRGNRGGHYDILRALYGYFVPDNTQPYVSNIAAYRLSSNFTSDHLHYRPTYRLDYRGWTLRERNVIENSIAAFKPEWQLPGDKFSDWHFMILNKKLSSNQYHYNKPVAVLSNAASFSATDGFLSAFSSLPQVMLIGQASSGGSGATRRFNLPNSDIEIALSSMASFRPNGQLYDGHGVDVDISLKPVPTDFMGETDVVLDEALNWIKTFRINN